VGVSQNRVDEMSLKTLLSFSAVGIFAGLSARCIKDARKGGDFGQIYSWFLGVFFGVLAISFACVGMLP
jgi:hypothetical protein